MILLSKDNLFISTFYKKFIKRLVIFNIRYNRAIYIYAAFPFE